MRARGRASCVLSPPPPPAVDGAESSLELLPARDSDSDEQMESCDVRRGTATAWTVW